MKYMIMECHPGYAVAMDEMGSFLKVVNRQYEVGQLVTDVIQMQPPAQKRSRKWLYSLSAMAACLVLLLGLLLPGMQQPYASVYVKINPEVRIDVDRQDRVIGLTGVNEDGMDLIQGYDFQKKNLDLVTDELVSRAIEMGYLREQGQIILCFDSTDQTWVDTYSHHLSGHLQNHLEKHFSVSILVEPHENHLKEDSLDNHSEKTGNPHSGHNYGASESTEDHHEDYTYSTPEDRNDHGKDGASHHGHGH